MTHSNGAGPRLARRAGAWWAVVAALLLMTAGAEARGRKHPPQRWPNGEVMSAWFADTTRTDIAKLGRRYVVTDYGVLSDSTVVQTEALQGVIDRCAREGGGVVVVPRGVFLTGALFFRQGTHLHLVEGGVLKGIDDIRHYPLRKTRLEGQTLTYFSALINADSLQGFTITGHGTINGNGLRFWEEFWLRRKFNPKCTNLEALRPRLVYLSHCKDVQVEDVSLVNSAFWTNHLYRCERVRYLGCTIYAPREPQESKAPSSDAIDIDVCRDVLVQGCYMSVNDDAVVIKGGKGTWADQDADNGPTSHVLVDGCHYGSVHGCLTLGSESLHDWNIVLRNCHVDMADRVLWLKMRPDTPQHYEYVRVENLTGACASFLVVRPWTQFYQPGDRPDMPLSRCNNITVRRVHMKCKNFFDVKPSDKYQLSDFAFENSDITDEAGRFDPQVIDHTTVKNLTINNTRLPDRKRQTP